MSDTKQVPQPKTYGPLGNLPLLDSAAPVQSLVKVASELGPIFQFQYPGGRRELYVSGHEYVKDACDEKRFDKRIWAPLQNVRPFAGDGLFTSATHEPNWKKHITSCSPALASVRCKATIRKWSISLCSLSRNGLGSTPTKPWTFLPT